MGTDPYVWYWFIVSCPHWSALGYLVLASWSFMSLQSLIISSLVVTLDSFLLISMIIWDIVQGNMAPVLQCLRSLRASFSFYDEEDTIQDHSGKRWNVSRLDKFPGIEGEERQWNSLDSKFQHGLHGTATSGTTIFLNDGKELLTVYTFVCFFTPLFIACRISIFCFSSTCYFCMKYQQYSEQRLKYLIFV